MAFEGYLLRFGSEEFPMNLIKYDTYKPVPNRVLDLNSGTLGDGTLDRTVSDHTRSTIDFTCNKMTGDVLEQYVMSLLRRHYISPKEKNLEIEYYCPDTCSYKKGVFYLDANTEFPIEKIDVKNKIVYHNEIKFSFVEY